MTPYPGCAGLARSPFVLTEHISSRRTVVVLLNRSLENVVKIVTPCIRTPVVQFDNGHCVRQKWTYRFNYYCAHRATYLTVLVRDFDWE